LKEKHYILLKTFLLCNTLGLYRTSHPVKSSGKFSKSRLSGNRTFSFMDARLSKFLRMIIKKKEYQKNSKFFMFVYFLKREVSI